MPTSAVPDAVDALVDILTAAAAAETVRVVDGPLVDVPVGDWLAVGYQPDADTSVAEQQDFASAGARRRDSNFTIACYIETRSGSVNMRVRRRRAYAIAALVENALRATDTEPEAPTLRGSVLWAHLITGDLRQFQGPDTCTAGLTISIACHARL